MALALFTTGGRGLSFVSPPPAFVSHHAVIRFGVRVLPREDQRLIRAEIISDSYYRSSDVALEGAAAPYVTWITWRDLPDGHYRIVATLYTATRDEAGTIATAFQVGQPD